MTKTSQQNDTSAQKKIPGATHTIKKDYNSATTRLQTQSPLEAFLSTMQPSPSVPAAPLQTPGALPKRLDARANCFDPSASEQKLKMQIELAAARSTFVEQIQSEDTFSQDLHQPNSRKTEMEKLLAQLQKRPSYVASLQVEERMQDVNSR